MKRIVVTIDHLIAEEPPGRDAAGASAAIERALERAMTQQGGPRNARGAEQRIAGAIHDAIRGGTR